MAENFPGEGALRDFLLFSTTQIRDAEAGVEDLEDGYYRRTVTQGDWQLENIFKPDSDQGYRDRDLVWRAGELVWFGFTFSRFTDASLIEPLDIFLEKASLNLDPSFPVAPFDGFEDERFVNRIAPMVSGQMSLERFVVVHRVLDKIRGDVPVLLGHSVGGLLDQNQLATHPLYRHDSSTLFAPEPGMDRSLDLGQVNNAN